MSTINVLFVCMGNICRSPMTQAVFEKLIENAGIAEHFFIDSAGTHAAMGQTPDSRGKEVLKNHGLTMNHIISRQIALQDFHMFDYIVAMDQNNVEHLRAICPKSQQHKISLLLSYSPELNNKDIPDPYTGGEQGFERVFEEITIGAKELLTQICKTHHLSAKS